MIYILAGNTDMAKQLAQSNGLLPKDWRAIYSIDSMYAAKNEVLWLGPEYQKHRHCKQILEEAVKRCFRVFSVQEVPKYTLNREEKE